MCWFAKLMNIKHNSESLVVQNSDTCAILLHLFLSEEPPERRKDAEKFGIFQDSNKTPTVYRFREENSHYTSYRIYHYYNFSILLYWKSFCKFSAFTQCLCCPWWLKLYDEVLPNVCKQDSWTQARVAIEWLAVNLHRWINSITIWINRKSLQKYLLHQLHFYNFYSSVIASLPIFLICTIRK